MATDPNPKLDANGQPIGKTTTNLSVVAPPMISGSSSNALPAGQAIRPRRAQAKPGQTLAATEQSFFDPKTGMYTGQQLVNPKGFLERGQYSSDEAYGELAKYTPIERRNLLNRFQQLGIYGKSKPSNSGFATRDLNAMREAMLWSNANGVTIEAAQTLMASEVGFAPSGATKRIRTTPKQDLTAVFRQAASSVLGRQLSDSEINKFVKSYNRMEVTEGTGGAIAPNAAVAAEQFVKTGSPQEAQAMGALTLTNIIDNAIKGLG
jgi:hypothetical protein